MRFGIGEWELGLGIGIGDWVMGLGLRFEQCYWGIWDLEWGSELKLVCRLKSTIELKVYMDG